MSVFEGISSERSTARDLDYLAYGLEVEKRASALSEALIDAIGDRPPGEALESTEAAESLP